MRRIIGALGVIGMTAAGTASGQQGPPPLPRPVTNNAVAGGRINGRFVAFSVLGVDSTKRWSGMTTQGYQWMEGEADWKPLPAVPGAEGRLAATAQVVRSKLYLFGGYTVNAAAAERSAPAVDIFDPLTAQWTAGAPIPVPVDDATSGVYRDSLIYLVSGWHDTGNVSEVQIYDVVTNRWRAGTPFPGTAVFGHSGSLAGQSIVVIDGAKKIPGPTRYALEPQSWLGTIDAADPTRIRWERLAAHPGPPLYRAASGPCGSRRIAFAGGTSNPYNYSGVGYDGKPSEPATGTMTFDLATKAWATGPAISRTMDHRGLLVRGPVGWVVGGMRPSQQVAGSSEPYPFPGC